jgi:Ca2+-transporting ATPase
MTLAIYGSSLQQGRSEIDARTITFASLVLANIGLILSNRFRSGNVFTNMRSKNRALRWILSIVVVLLAVVIYVPPVRDLFSFSPLQAMDIVLCIGIGIISIVGCELIKYLNRPKIKKS